MKFVAFAAPVLALLLTGASAAQDQGPAPTFSAEAFRSHVAFLADDALEGREAGTRGYEIAARYVATQFEGLGLRPGANGGWFQPIHFIRYAQSGTPTLAVQLNPGLNDVDYAAGNGNRKGAPLARDRRRRSCKSHRSANSFANGARVVG